MKHVRTPRDLFFDQLNDIHSMENQLCDAMPQLAALSSDGGLREAIVTHSSETVHHRGVVNEIFSRHGVSVSSDKCKAIAGLIEGGETHLKSVGNFHTRDLMMIAHCLRIEHYEMAAYEIASRLASRLGMELEAGVLGELMHQEKRMAERLLELEPYIFQTARQKV